MSDHKADTYSFNPPVVTGADADGDALLAYRRQLQDRSLADISAQEARRLEGNFGKMGAYMEEILRNDTGQAQLNPREKAKLPELLKPSKLCMIFNAMSSFSRNILLSEVVVMTTDVLDNPATKALFNDKPQFDVPFMHRGHSLRFGFLQILRDDADGIGKSSTSVPTYMLDHAVTQQLPDAFVRPLMEIIQTAINIANHDVLHHLTMPVLNPDIAERHAGERMRRTPIHGWKPIIPHKSPKENAYEEWAHLSHQKTMLFNKNSGVTDSILSINQKFFDTLDAARRHMDAAGQDAAAVADAIDYMSTTYLHTLGRLLPLNHALMNDALARAEAVDPAAASITLNTLEVMISSKMPAQFDNRQAMRMIGSIATGKPGLVDIIESYRRSGCEMIPDPDSGTPPYAALKRLQLAALSIADSRAHMPTPVDPMIAELHKRHDKSMLHMILAADRTVS